MDVEQAARACWLAWLVCVRGAITTRYIDYFYSCIYVCVSTVCMRVRVNACECVIFKINQISERRRHPGEPAIYLTLDTPLRSFVCYMLRVTGYGRRLGGSSDIRG